VRYRVELTASTERDLGEIHGWIAEHDSPERADRWLDRVLEVVTALETSPDRGAIPAELREIGIREFRQVYFKPYRLVYRVNGRNVTVMLITDGRRDLSALLARRLLD
jgi:toxin ParE1/3/4